MKYFKNLHAGWADLEIEDFKGRISYIRNIPWDILRAYEEYLIFGHCIIPFDEEKTDFYIYVNDIEIIIIRSDAVNQRQIFIIQEIPAQFIKNIALDVALNIKEWCEWNNIVNESYDIINNKIKELEYACLRLDLLETKIIDFPRKGFDND